MSKKGEYIIKELSDWNALDIKARRIINSISFKPFLVRITGLKRTLDQNALLHAVVSDCAKKTGIKDAHWWKDELKLKLGLKEVHFDLDEQPFVIVVSTTRYSTKQMGQFVEKIQAYMKTEYDIDIELPNEFNNA